MKLFQMEALLSGLVSFVDRPRCEFSFTSTSETKAMNITQNALFYRNNWISRVENKVYFIEFYRQSLVASR